MCKLVSQIIYQVIFNYGPFHTVLMKLISDCITFHVKNGIKNVLQHFFREFFVFREKRVHFFRFCEKFRTRKMCSTMLDRICPTRGLQLLRVS